MPPILLAPWCPLAVGLVIGCVAFIVRHFVLKRPRTVNYFPLFMDAGVAYVLVILLINHYIFNVPYATMLSGGFGIEAVGVAFLYATYHMIAEIFYKIGRAN